MLDKDDLLGSIQIQVEAESIGDIAYDSISNIQAGKVVGKTSRGLFVKAASKWMIFISYEMFRSPLTINIIDNNDWLERINHDALIQISDQQLVFPESHLVISAQNSDVWRVHLPSTLPLPAKERYERLESTAIEVFNITNEDGLVILIPKLLDSPRLVHQFMRKLSPFEENVIQNLNTQPFSSNPNLEDFLVKLLGYGSGLTPSGDDFVTGFLLALNRWRDALFLNRDINELNHNVVDAAYRKTTTLSANLIECASSGQGDERLLAAIDWLMGDQSANSDSIQAMLKWGSSSGGDVFTGFVAALTIPNDNK